jgi:hypothetical protein
MATNDRCIVHNANPGIGAAAVRLEHTNGTVCSGTWRPPGAVFLPHQRDQEAARSNRRASPVSVRVTSQWCAQEAADQAARTPWPPVVANMVEDHHEGVLHAACGR